MSLSAATLAPRRNVLLRLAPFVLIIFCTYLTVAMPLAALPLHVHDVLGFSDLTVGLTISVQSLVTLATRQFAGSLCDRNGPKFGALLGGAVAARFGITAPFWAGFVVAIIVSAATWHVFNRATVAEAYAEPADPVPYTWTNG